MIKNFTLSPKVQPQFIFNIIKYEIWVNMNHGWIWIRGEYEIWVNMNYGWIWIMGEYEFMVNMKYGSIWIMGEYELWENMIYLLRWLTYSSCGGLWPLSKVFFYLWLKLCWPMAKALNYGWSKVSKRYLKFQGLWKVP